MARDTGAAIVTELDGQRHERSRDIRRVQLDGAILRAERIERDDADGGDILRISGYASITDTPYEVASWWGAWEETIASGAFEVTLASDPTVILRANHTDLPLASTVSGTLRLEEDDTGLRFEADLQAERSDALDVYLGVERGDINECSFAGWIVEFTERADSLDWTINEIDLDRGDVAVVSFGANPETSVDIARARRSVLAPSTRKSTRTQARDDEARDRARDIARIAQPSSRELAELKADSRT